MGPAGAGDVGLGMKAGASTSITTLSNGSYEVTFQANTGSLWSVGGDQHGDWGLGMRDGTSPSITALPGGGYEIAFQANTSSLWVAGSQGTGDIGLGMKDGTSPSITTLANDSYRWLCRRTPRTCGPSAVTSMAIGATA